MSLLNSIGLVPAHCGPCWSCAGKWDLVNMFACSHAIVSSSVGPEYYVSILSFVDKTQLEPGCSVLMHNKVMLKSTCLAV